MPCLIGGNRAMPAHRSILHNHITPAGVLAVITCHVHLADRHLKAFKGTHGTLEAQAHHCINTVISVLAGTPAVQQWLAVQALGAAAAMSPGPAELPPPWLLCL